MRISDWSSDVCSSDLWDRLAGEASEPNPFAERWCLQSALHLLDPERQARLIMVRDGNDGPVIGIMPIAPARHYGRLPLRHVAGWAHPNHFHGAPLVHAGFKSLRSEEHTSELQSLMRISYAVFCLKKKN